MLGLRVQGPTCRFKVLKFWASGLGWMRVVPCRPRSCREGAATCLWPDTYGCRVSGLGFGASLRELSQTTVLAT